MSLLYRVLSGIQAGGWGRMDTTSNNLPLFTAPPSMPAQCLKLYIAKSYGYSDFCSSKAIM